MPVETWLKEEKGRMMMELLELQELNLNWKPVERKLKEQRGYM